MIITHEKILSEIKNNLFEASDGFNKQLSENEIKDLVVKIIKNYISNETVVEIFIEVALLEKSQINNELHIHSGSEPGVIQIPVIDIMMLLIIKSYSEIGEKFLKEQIKKFRINRKYNE